MSERMTSDGGGSSCSPSRSNARLVEIELDPAVVDRANPLGWHVPLRAEQPVRDGETVEDVLVAVADDLVHLAEVCAVGTTDEPALLDQEPGDGVAHTTFPSTYQTGPWVSTLWVSESARRIETRPVIPSASARAKHLRVIGRRGPVAEAAGDSKAEHRSAGDPSGIDRGEQERAALEVVARGELELAVEIAPVGGKARDGGVPARQERRRLRLGLDRGGRDELAQAKRSPDCLALQPARAAARPLRGRRLRPRPHRGGPRIAPRRDCGRDWRGRGGPPHDRAGLGRGS